MFKLKSIHIENSGAIERLKIDFPMNEDGRPKPVVLVGENGSGKTTALSFVVDSFLQLASQKFNDVLNQQGLSTMFYRVRSHDIRVGCASSEVHIRYEFEGKEFDYLDRVGGGDVEEIRRKFNLQPDFSMDAAERAEKAWSRDSEKLTNELQGGAYLFFPSGRREIPHWFQEKSLNPELYSNKPRFSQNLNKALIIDSAVENLATWLMDNLLDAVIGQPQGHEAANTILRIILGDDTAHFAFAPRQVWPRVQIFVGVRSSEKEAPSSNPRRLIIPSLAHLSAGQSMLLSMFGTIANQGTLTKRKPLEEIEGIVVIDEIEVYLHTQFQQFVLPRLIGLFPKVQFLISTHSPSFLMGMRAHLGNDGFEVKDMPTGEIIDSDQFSEIGAAVESLSQSTAFRKQVTAEISKQNEGPILILEGRSDAIIVEALWAQSVRTPLPFRVMVAKGRRALRYLLEDEQFIGEVGKDQRVLGIFDFDEAFDDWNGCSQMYPIRSGNDSSGLRNKHREKNIYSALLPVPVERASQAGKLYGAKSSFTIEMYLSNEQLKQGENLETILSPGNFEIVRFQGNKVAFAERVAENYSSWERFDSLLVLIREILVV